MKKQLLFYVFMIPVVMFSQTYESYGDDVYDPLRTSNDRFGDEIAISSDGNTMIVSSKFYSTSSADEDYGVGKAAVFQKISNVWTKIGNDILGTGERDFLGSSLDINAAGNIIAVGASNSAINGTGASTGYVRVFQNIGGTWTQLGSDFIGQIGYTLGSSVSLRADGMRIAIGASGVNFATGEVKVYDYLAGSWTQVGSTMSGIVQGDRFGASIDFNNDGGYLAVGAPFVDSNGTPSGQNTGQVKVFHFTTDWNQIFVATGFNQNDIFGSKVALSGNKNVLAVSALQSLNFNANNDDGYVQTFNYSSGTNTYSFFRFINGDGDANDRFGSSIALNEDGLFLAVGAPFDDTFGSNSGKTYLYKRSVISPTVWNLLPGEFDDDATSGNGRAVALSSNGGILGTSSYAIDPNSESGVVKVYADPSTLSVQDIQSVVELTVYPNPTNGVLNIRNVTNLEIIDIRVTDVLGRVCLEIQMNVLNPSTINLNSLNSGTYLVEFKGNNFFKTFKIIKK